MKENLSSSPGATKLLLGPKQMPVWYVALFLAIQHVFAMFGATVLVPILVNDGTQSTVLSIAVALFTSGTGTLIYQFCTGWKSPVYLGSSFAFIAPMIAAYSMAGTGGMMTGLMTVGVVYVVVSLLVWKIGRGWIDKLLPPIVIGPAILIIGLGLSTTAISSIGLDSAGNFSWPNVIAALITFSITVVAMIFAKGKVFGFLRIIPFLTGIVLGTVVSYFLGIVDLTPIKEADWGQIPAFAFPFIQYAPNFNAIWTIAPVALATMAEHIGDHKAVSVIMGEDLLKDPGLHRTLLGDGLATLWAALFGGPANTSYGENTAVVGMTKIASVGVVTIAAIMAIVLAFIGKFTAAVSVIPGPVLGGVEILLYGFIALNGAKVLVNNHINFDYSRNVVIAATMLVLGIGGAIVSFVIGDVSIAFSGTSLATIIGVILNKLLPIQAEEKAEQVIWQRLDEVAKQLAENPSLTLTLTTAQ